jgi:dual specificity tyrosine-phosphorylation-regulated kinase 1
VYYEAKAAKLREQKDTNRVGVHNDGYDDQNYDYILQGDEVINGRYVLKHKMGKVMDCCKLLYASFQINMIMIKFDVFMCSQGSFGQVVSAYDTEKKVDVAIKIIKSRKPFLVQARTEIDILTKLRDMDPDDSSNIVRLLDQFIYRNHQCIVFELLSFNLYELLKNTRYDLRRK